MGLCQSKNNRLEYDPTPDSDEDQYRMSPNSLIKQMPKSKVYKTLYRDIWYKNRWHIGIIRCKKIQGRGRKVIKRPHFIIPTMADISWQYLMSEEFPPINGKEYDINYGHLCDTMVTFAPLHTHTYQVEEFALPHGNHITTNLDQLQLLYWYSKTQSTGYIIIIHNSKIHKYNIYTDEWRIFAINTNLNEDTCFSSCIDQTTNILFMMSVELFCVVNLETNDLFISKAFQSPSWDKGHYQRITSLFLETSKNYENNIDLKFHFHKYDDFTGNHQPGILLVHNGDLQSEHEQTQIRCKLDSDSLFFALENDTKWVYSAVLNRMYFIDYEGVSYEDIGSGTSGDLDVEYDLLEGHNYIDECNENDHEEINVFTACLVLSRIIVLFCWRQNKTYFIDVIKEKMVNV